MIDLASLSEVSWESQNSIFEFCTMAKIFISYSTKNKQRAFAFVSGLESHGLTCWIAQRDINPGSGNYGAAIVDAVNSADVLLLLLTEESNRSIHVAKEVERAVSKKVPVLVVKLAQVELSKELEYYVSTAQWLDVATKPPDKQLQQTRKAASHFCGRPSQSPVEGSTIAYWPKCLPWFIPPGLTLVVVIAVVALLFVFARLPRVAKVGAKPIPSSGQAPVQSPTPPIAVNAHNKKPPMNLSNPLASMHAPADETSLAPQSMAFAETDKKTGALSSSPARDTLATIVKERITKRESFLQFAKERLPKFYSEAISASVYGSIQPGEIVDQGIDLVASCRLSPDLPAYRRLARSIIEYLELVTTNHGKFSSDGLKTGAGVKLEVALKENQRTLLTSVLGLPRIFENRSQRNTVISATRNGQNKYLACEELLNVFSPEVTGSRLSGISPLFNDVLYEYLTSDSGGVLLILEDADASYRRTSWRWFCVNESDWSLIFSYLPRLFVCEFELLSPEGDVIESDNYELKDYGASQEYGKNMRIVAPFFVGDDAEYYAPEVILRKPMLVMQSEVGKIKDQNVRITAAVKEKAWE